MTTPLLDLVETSKEKARSSDDDSPLKIVLGCLVKKIQHSNGRATVLETSKGDVHLGKAKLVLAMSTLPSTTLMLNSFPKSDFPLLEGIGERFTGHFLSTVVARMPASSLVAKNSKLKLSDLQENLQMGSVYVAGYHDNSYKSQFHIQVIAIADSKPMENIHESFRCHPDLTASMSVPLEQLQASCDPLHVIFICSVMGQIDHENPENWFHLMDSQGTEHQVDITCNCSLQVVANSRDKNLWDTMDMATHKLLKEAVGDELEYLHDRKEWKKDLPTSAKIRAPCLVHEQSTMWIGDDQDPAAPVGLNYCFRGVENVYLTGGALLPTGGSWNPTYTMVALAMHLADVI